jgi:hypothetical protein
MYLDLNKMTWRNLSKYDCLGADILEIRGPRRMSWNKAKHISKKKLM